MPTRGAPTSPAPSTRGSGQGATPARAIAGAGLPGPDCKLHDVRFCPFQFTIGQAASIWRLASASRWIGGRGRARLQRLVAAVRPVADRAARRGVGRVVRAFRALRVVRRVAALRCMVAALAGALAALAGALSVLLLTLAVLAIVAAQQWGASEPDFGNFSAAFFTVRRARERERGGRCARGRAARPLELVPGDT